MKNAVMHLGGKNVSSRYSLEVTLGELVMEKDLRILVDHQFRNSKQQKNILELESKKGH